MITRFRVPYVFVDDDYWSPAYVWDMPITWSTLQDLRPASNECIIEVDVTEEQRLFLVSQPDATELEQPRSHQ